MTFSMSLDVGGTFTDLCVLDRDSGIRSFYKSFTTHTDLALGVLNAIQVASYDKGLSISELLRQTERIVHGTTVATNALIEGEGSRVGAIVTKGFRDVLYMRQGSKKTSPFDYQVDYPDPFIPRYLTLPVSERTNSEGEIETPLDEEEARVAVKRLVSLGVEAICVLFLWSVSNPTNEKRMSEIIALEAPSVPSFLSHEVNPVIREYRRFISTAINASLFRLVREYSTSLEANLRANQFAGQLFMITSSGGVVSPKEISGHPILMVDSGPSMLPVASLKHAKEEFGTEDLMCIDLGGTSLDVASVREGKILMTWDSEVGSDFLGISKVDVRSIGAGGGSIAWVDTGGLVHVGPQSAGSEPGPACYGRGGTHPTVTDANLLLGYLNPGSLLGGRLKLDRSLSEKAIKTQIADRLEMDLVRAAFLINTVVNTNMVNSIREYGIKRGIDPSDFVLVSGGAAAGLHALFLARELRMKHVIIPKSAGVLSAYGGLEANITRQFAQSYYMESGRVDYDRINSIFQNLERRASSFLFNANIPKNEWQLDFAVECRYPNQVYELEVPLQGNKVTPKILEDATQAFHELHQRMYLTRDISDRLEFINWKVVATGITENKPEPRWNLRRSKSDRSNSRKGKRSIWLEEAGGAINVGIYDGDSVSEGDAISGPALIEEPTTTILIYPGQTAKVRKSGTYAIELA